jgi:archaellum biogenesis protein FlaJ (TadC family)
MKWSANMYKYYGTTYILATWKISEINILTLYVITSLEIQIIINILTLRVIESGKDINDS